MKMNNTQKILNKIINFIDDYYKIAPIFYKKWLDKYGISNLNFINNMSIEEENDQQYEDDQMNPDDIMPDTIDTIDDDEIFEDIPESLKLTKQFQDELKEIDINDIWDDELKPEIKAKKCIVYGKEYTETTNRKNYCQNCIDKQEILDKSARRYRDNQKYNCADEL